ncbi:hypothetical protein [Mycobacterium deserti]|uniref:DUF4386 family protein n=1 Tax=Mycobacterium deserti TaxID=2978347 RepID=A0ABT2M4I7_9MYCO|nr:hypothetical protein [Mycobacterium deserti]MCT7657183.1 hypothetical protein [Mycobacterium deserti]
MTMRQPSFDKQLERLGAWSGIVWVIFAAGAFLGGRLVPPRSPSMDPVDFAAFVADHRYAILIGMLALFIGGYTFLITWSITLAYQIKKYANPSPLSFCVSVAVGVNGGIIGMLCGILGTAMAYRVEVLDPVTTQLLYDMILFLFLSTWPPFVLWLFVVGFAILSSENRQTMFPRWTGFMSLWAGTLEVAGAVLVFYYEGPFSYSGLVSFWVPGASFFSWVLVMALVQVRGWSRVQDDQPGQLVVKHSSAEPDYERGSV